MSSSPKQSRKDKTVPVGMVERERTKSGFRVFSIFGAGEKGAMVPSSPQASSRASRDLRNEPTLTRTRAVPSSPNDRGPAGSTAPSGTRQNGFATQPIVPSKHPSSKTEDSSGIGIVLIIALVGLALLAGVDGVNSGSSDGSETSGAKSYDLGRIRDSAEYHRAITGAQLNRERSEIAIENNRVAPPLPNSAVPVQKPSQLDGVPLVGEPRHRQSSRDRSKPLSPDYADSRVMYGLQEEQVAGEWEKRAQAEYVKEFVANAAAAGYQLKLDKNLNVIDVKRIPQSERVPSYDVPQQGARTNGGAAR